MTNNRGLGSKQSNIYTTIMIQIISKYRENKGKIYVSSLTLTKITPELLDNGHFLSYTFAENSEFATLGRYFFYNKNKVIFKTLASVFLCVITT